MKLADLAAMAGVSTATVSRALSGHPSVSKTTQERIRALAREHGVRPNQLARNLRLRSTGAIALAMPLGPEEAQAEFFIWAGGNGGGYFKDGEWVINSPENVETLTFLKELVDMGCTQSSPATTTATTATRALRRRASATGTGRSAAGVRRRNRTEATTTATTRATVTGAASASPNTVVPPGGPEPSRTPAVTD